MTNKVEVTSETAVQNSNNNNNNNNNNQSTMESTTNYNYHLTMQWLYSMKQQEKC
jgi:hypothetical protein